METFRCPTCLGVVADANARRCTFCRANIRRKRPKVLGEESRLGANLLPIDRWMIDRIDGTTKGRHAMKPVAWHGRFATSPLAEPDFAATPSPVATPLSPPTHVAEPPAPAHAPAPQQTVIEEPVDTPPVVGALALDMYTMPVPRTDEQEAEAIAPPVAPVPEPPEPMTPPEAMVYVPPTTATAIRPVVAHEELDPEVRALVDDLYEQARAELAGGEFMMLAPIESDPIEQEYEPFPALDELDELDELEEYAPELPEVVVADEDPVIETPPALPVLDAQPPARPRPRSGWHPAAFVADRDERHRSH